MSRLGTTDWREGQSVRSATASTALNVVTVIGRCDSASTCRAPTTTETIAVSMSRSRFKNAQNADPSVTSDRRATLPDFFSYVANAGSASVTSDKYCASWATLAFGAASGPDVGASVVVDVVTFGSDDALPVVVNTHAPAPITITVSTATPTINVRGRRRLEVTLIAKTCS